MPDDVYKPLVGIVLMYAAWRSFRSAGTAEPPRDDRPYLPILIAAGALYHGRHAFVPSIRRDHTSIIRASYIFASYRERSAERLIRGNVPPRGECTRGLEKETPAGREPVPFVLPMPVDLRAYF